VGGLRAVALSFAVAPACSWAVMRQPEARDSCRPSGFASAASSPLVAQIDTLGRDDDVDGQRGQHLIQNLCIGYMHEDVPAQRGDPARFTRFFVYFKPVRGGDDDPDHRDNYLMLVRRLGRRGAVLLPAIGFLVEKGARLGIWERPAGKKAFVTNRIGTWFLLCHVPDLLELSAAWAFRGRSSSGPKRPVRLRRG